ncbi:histidine phosphatase family protein [Brachybacterium sp. GPGPB12]|uniref:SixA phosphatase family protein n=1 Tax=Brachybacterium sp. GPGPB12 TaxID=3023517 RepID=UPI003134557B
MRHGKAENSSGQPDHERALAERGQSQARLVGEYLAAQNVQVSRVLVSDSTRTAQTWEGVRSQMPDFDGEVTSHEEIYSGGPSEPLSLVRGVAPEHAVVLVIGHEPTISSLSARWRTRTPTPGRPRRPASACRPVPCRCSPAPWRTGRPSARTRSPCTPSSAPEADATAPAPP